MGEIAEMMLDGILDASGAYTGHDYGHPVYPKGWFGENTLNYGNKVNCFLKARGIIGVEPKNKLVAEYGDHLDLNLKKFGKICKVICKDDKSWKKFKTWVDKKNGYTKPSKIKS